jgi:hypothetical protein
VEQEECVASAMFDFSRRRRDAPLIATQLPALKGRPKVI